MYSNEHMRHLDRLLRESPLRKEEPMSSARARKKKAKSKKNQEPSVQTYQALAAVEESEPEMEITAEAPDHDIFIEDVSKFPGRDRNEDEDTVESLRELLAQAHVELENRGTQITELQDKEQTLLRTIVIQDGRLEQTRAALTEASNQIRSQSEQITGSGITIGSLQGRIAELERQPASRQLPTIQINTYRPSLDQSIIDRTNLNDAFVDHIRFDGSPYFGGESTVVLTGGGQVQFSQRAAVQLLSTILRDFPLEIVTPSGETRSFAPGDAAITAGMLVNSLDTVSTSLVSDIDLFDVQCVVPVRIHATRVAAGNSLEAMETLISQSIIPDMFRAGGRTGDFAIMTAPLADRPLFTQSMPIYRGDDGEFRSHDYQLLGRRSSWSAMQFDRNMRV